MSLSKNLISLLERKQVNFRRSGEDHHVSKQNWIGLVCPWCGRGGDKFHLGIDTYTGRANCWKCGRKEPKETIARVCRIPIAEVYKLFKESRIIKSDEYARTYLFKQPKGVEDLKKPHISYLIRRGFNPDTIIKLWGVRGIGLQEKLKWRIYIPIKDRNGRDVSWTTRSIADNVERKYISAKKHQEDISHKSILYGSHLARHAVIVVEGPIDAWAVGPGAVATFGISYTKEQVAAISKYPVRIICYDTADSAQEQAERLCRSLQIYDGVTENVLLETGSDPADCDPEEVTEVRSRYL